MSKKVKSRMTREQAVQFHQDIVNRVSNKKDLRSKKQRFFDYLRNIIGFKGFLK